MLSDDPKSFFNLFYPGYGIWNLIRKDKIDGFWYVDYLKAMRSELDHDSDYIPLLRQHKEKIAVSMQQFEKRDYKIFQKYEWLKNYHNASICELRLNGNLKID